MSARKLTQVTRPDFDAVRAEAASVVAAELGRIASPEDRVRCAAEIIAKANEEIADLKPKRDAAALSLWAYEYVRGIEMSMGVSEQTWVRTRRRVLGLTEDEQLPAAAARTEAARQAGIKRLSDAAATLPRISEDLERARARRKAAQQVRDTTSPRTIRISHPEFDPDRTEASTAVAAELGRIASPEDRIRRAVEIMAEADEQAADLKTKRDAAALSLWAYDGVRSIELTMGVSKNAWVKVHREALGLAPEDPLPRVGQARIQAAEKAGIKNLGQEAYQLSDLAMELVRVRARRKEAQAFRDATAKVLLAEPYSWEQQQVAELIGKAPSLVSGIAKRAG